MDKKNVDIVKVSNKTTLLLQVPYELGIDYAIKWKEIVANCVPDDVTVLSMPDNIKITAIQSDNTNK